MPEGRQGREGALAEARALAASALAALEANRERIDDLNVFPVPDGDTGTNMALTVRALRDALASSTAATPHEVARDVTRAALMGARGNSGVLLSQLVSGAAPVLADSGTVNAAVLAAALRRAAQAAYSSVREPQEGTLLTVARDMAECAEALARDGRPLPDALGAVVARGERALARTRDQLPVLREAGVVDAGAAGLLEIVRGIAAHVRGEALPSSPAERASLPLAAVHHDPSRYRYCTSFYVEGGEADPERLERELERLGDSLLVVGTRGAVKAHLHTDEPGRALALATAVGVVEEVEVKNMRAQAAEREQRLAHASVGASDVVAVVAGAGNARLFESLGAARIVEGGASAPPVSVILAEIAAVRAEDVIVLPNDENAVARAEQAAAASAKRVHVVPTTSIQAGLAAMVAFDRAAGADENAREMEAAARSVRTGAVAAASPETAASGPRESGEGRFVGLVDGRPVVAGAARDAVAREVVARLLGEGADVLTILLGDGVEGGEELRGEIAAAHPELEVEVHEGGQADYPLLFSAE
ncbi:MAG: DAK2 domain-containing protein [Actinomycetota bacterium]|nr:DAK2 domain-containing protein [Actinomycetota bacterium]